jgi:hypothetical protein
MASDDGGTLDLSGGGLLVGQLAAVETREAVPRLRQRERSPIAASGQKEARHEVIICSGWPVLPQFQSLLLNFCRVEKDFFPLLLLPPSSHLLHPLFISPLPLIILFACSGSLACNHNILSPITHPQCCPQGYRELYVLSPVSPELGGALSRDIPSTNHHRSICLGLPRPSSALRRAARLWVRPS